VRDEEATRVSLEENKEIQTEGIVIRRVRDGKIVEYWSVTDLARVLQQLGVLPGAGE
jgi:predicted ester cyclase